jgi:transposase
MVNNSITFIGLDTHKKFLEVAFIEDNRDAKPVNLEPINGTKPALQKLVRQFESKHAGSTLHFVYEAGPCGYWIYRFLTSMGHCCYVVAPSLIPKKAGELIKTDKRNALKLALLLRSGDMQPIYVPPSRGIFCVLSVAKQNISHCLGLLYAFI